MSFYTDARPGIFPCQTNNPMHGLCERICIQTTKVFDACMLQANIEDYTLTLTDFTPANPTTPLTFVSGSSTGAPATITDLKITRFDDRPNFARVQANVNIPVTVTYTDFNNQSGSASGTITITQDVIMYVHVNYITRFKQYFVSEHTLFYPGLRGRDCNGRVCQFPGPPMWQILSI